MPKIVRVKSFRALGRLMNLAHSLRVATKVVDMQTSHVLVSLDGEKVDELLRELSTMFDDAHVEVVEEKESAPPAAEPVAEPIAEQPAEPPDEEQAQQPTETPAETTIEAIPEFAETSAREEQKRRRRER